MVSGAHLHRAKPNANAAPTHGDAASAIFMA
jgi:hypothetical protein